MKQFFYNWDEFKVDIKALIAEMSLSQWIPDCLIGVNRGGLVPATVLSHYMNVPLFVSYCETIDGKNVIKLNEIDENFKNKKLLIVDDICDDGDTLIKICQALKEKQINNFKTCALFSNISKNFIVDFKARKIDRNKDKFWVVFPWEI